MGENTIASLVIGSTVHVGLTYGSNTKTNNVCIIFDKFS